MTQAPQDDSAKRFLKAISLDSIISGFKTYRQTYEKVLRSPRRFARNELMPWQPGMLQSAIAIYLYGIALSFVLYIPLIQKHGLSLGKVLFLLQFTYSQLLLVLVLHLSIKVFRGKGVFGQTAAAHCIYMGLVTPIFMLLTYPLFFYVPAGDFLPGADLDVSSAPRWVFWWTLFVLIGMSVGLGLVVFQWLADLHHVTKRRLFVGMIVIAFPLIGLHHHFVGPYVRSGLNLISDFLSKLA